jgi:hypothetical protein
MSQASGNEMPTAGFWPPVLFVPQRRTGKSVRTPFFIQSDFFALGRKAIQCPEFAY